MPLGGPSWMGAYSGCIISTEASQPYGTAIFTEVAADDRVIETTFKQRMHRGTT